MSREIKFRGVCEKSNQIVIGDLIHGVGWKKGMMFILPLQHNLAYIKHCDPLDGVKVLSESVEEYTGLKDSKGNEIYEGDRLYVSPGYSSIVNFQDGMFVSVYSHPEDGETIPLIDVIGKDTEVINDDFVNRKDDHIPDIGKKIN